MLCGDQLSPPARQQVWTLKLPSPSHPSVFKVPRRQQGGHLDPLFSYRKATKIQRDADDKHTWLSGNNQCPLSPAGTNFASSAVFPPITGSAAGQLYFNSPKPMKVFEIPQWGNSTGRISDREHEADFHYVRQITYSLCFT